MLRISSITSQQYSEPLYKIQNKGNFSVFNGAQNPTDSVNFSAKNNTKQTGEMKAQLNEVRSKQGLIGNLWDGFKNLTGIGAGSNKVEKAIEQLEKGEITQEEAQKALNGYSEGQKMCVDVFADVVSGILAVGAFAFAVPTGGASLAIGLAAATAVGAGTKIAIKGGDALLTGKEYSGKDLLYDTATGAINGLLAPVTNGIGASLTKTVGTKLGLSVVKEGAEAVVEQSVKQGLKSMIVTQSVDVIGGNAAKRALALGAGMAVDGAIGGAADNMVRAGLKGENVLEAGVQGAVGGLIMAPVIGGGMRMAGKAGNKLASKMHKPEVAPKTTTSNVKNVLTEPAAGDNVGVHFGSIKKSTELLDEAVFSSYETSVSKLETLSRAMDADIDSISQFKNIENIQNVLNQLEKTTDAEKALQYKVQLLNTAHNEGVKVNLASDIDSITGEATKIRTDFAQKLQDRLNNYAAASLDKDLPDITSLVAKLSKETGIEPKQCAQIVESMTKYSSLDDFRALAKLTKGSEILIPDEIGFEQSAHYIMRKKLDIRDSRGTYVPDFSSLDKLDPSVKYTILADSARLDSIKGVKLPDNVKVVYVGDVQNSTNMFTSMTSESIEKQFKNLLAQNGNDIDSLLKSLSTKDGYSAIDLKGQKDGVLEVLKNRFQSRAKGVAGFDNDMKHILSGEENLTLSEIFNLFERKQQMMSIFTDEDILSGIKATGKNVQEYALSKGVNPDEIAYVVGEKSSKVFDVKSQHLLAYRMKLLNEGTQFINIDDAMVNHPAKLLVYFDDFVGSGNSTLDVSNKISSAALGGGVDREILITPLISNPNAIKKLSYKFKDGQVKLFDSPYGAKNFGLSQTAEPRTLAQLNTLLDNNDYVKLSKAMDSFVKNPKDGIHVYDIRHYEQYPVIKDGVKTAILFRTKDAKYASRIPPYMAQHDILAYQGCATGVLTPTMGSNTNNNNVNYFFKELLGDNGVIVKYNDISNGMEKHNFYHIIDYVKGEK